MNTYTTSGDVKEERVKSEVIFFLERMKKTLYEYVKLPSGSIQSVVARACSPRAIVVRRIYEP